jgi:uncharacterized protein (TIGR02145 family)
MKSPFYAEEITPTKSINHSSGKNKMIAPAFIDDQTTKTEFYLYSEEADIYQIPFGVSILSPEGISLDSTSINVNYYHDVTTGLKKLTVFNPSPGKWEITPITTTPEADTIDYVARTKLASEIKLISMVGLENQGVNTPFNFSSALLMPDVSKLDQDSTELYWIFKKGLFDSDTLLLTDVQQTDTGFIFNGNYTADSVYVYNYEIIATGIYNNYRFERVVYGQIPVIDKTSTFNIPNQYLTLYSNFEEINLAEYLNCFDCNYDELEFEIDTLFISDTASWSISYNSQNQELNVSGFAQEPIEISFEVLCISPGNSQLTDTFNVYYTPPCNDPENLDVSFVATTSAGLVWSEFGNENQWDLLWVRSGYDPEIEGTLVEEIADSTYTITDLESGVSYDFYVRAQCWDSAYSFWSGPRNFKTHQVCPDYPSVTYEGQTYSTILIGDQCWMSENLNAGEMILLGDTTRSRDDLIKFCYNDDPANCEIYGGLYNRYNLSDNLCPEGWHVPSHEEWKTLEGFADSEYDINDPIWDDTGWRGFDAGKKLKSSSLWNGTDEFGFNFLPAGYIFWISAPGFESEFFGLGTEGIIFNRECNSANDNISQLEEFIGFAVTASSMRCIKSDYTPPVSCPAPENLVISASYTEAIVSWIPIGAETYWDIIVGSPGFNPNNNGMLYDSIESIPYTVGSLQPASSFDCYVRAFCNKYDKSVWVGPVSFTTQDLLYPPPTNLAGENYQNGAKLTWDSPQTDSREILSNEPLPVLEKQDGEELCTEVSGVPMVLNPDFIPDIKISRSELYNNGPLVNSPGTGANGMDESVLQISSLSMITYGFGCQKIGANSIADDFEVTGTWSIESFEFFAYQTGSSLTSSLTGAYLRIYDGDPRNGGNIIYGDLINNCMVETEFSNIYRVNETTSGNTDRPVMRVVCETPGLVLNQGTYWFEYTLEGSLTSGPWAPPITVNGIATTGNGSQFVGAENAWFDLNDHNTQTRQGVPFILHGVSENISFDLAGYKVYRNGGYLEDLNSDNLEFIDIPLNEGIYEYEVTAVYNSPYPGESVPAGPVQVVIEPCNEPTELSADNVTVSSAEIEWIAGGSETEWQINYGFEGIIPGYEGNVIESVMSNYFTLSSLSPVTNYDCYVRAVCNDGYYSNWAGPVSFITNNLYCVILMPNPEAGGIAFGGGFYEVGSEVTVIAEPNFGWDFINWTEAGLEVSSDSAYTFIIDNDRELVANFEPECVDPTANAGLDQTTCENAEILLYSTAENYSSLQWSGGAGSFDDPTTLTPIYTPAAGETGAVELCLTAYPIPPCTEIATDCMELFIQALPEVDAGEDFSACDNVQQIQLDGFATNYSNVHWTTSGEGFFDDDGIENPGYYPSGTDLINGYVELCLNAGPINPCQVEVTDCLMLTFIPSPFADSGDDVTICVGDDYQFTGAFAENYSALIWTTSGDGTFDNTTILNPVYTPGSADVNSGGVEICLEALPLPGCTISHMNCMVLTIIEQPYINLPAHDSLDCEFYDFSTESWLPIYLNFEGSYNNVQWTTSGDGTFSNPAAMPTEYNLGFVDQYSGQVTLSVIASNECSSNTYEISLTIPRQLIYLDDDSEFVGISSYLDLSDMSVPEVLAPIKDCLHWFRDENGAYYWPVANANQLGNWQAIGYRAELDCSCCLPLYGEPLIDCSFLVNSPTLMNINYIPVLSEFPVEIEQLFSGHLEDIVSIYDWTTNTMYVPGVQSELTMLIPGRAYQLQKTGPATFTIYYPCSGPETHTITTVANPVEGGTTNGDGVYPNGALVTISAQENDGWQFVNWTEDGEEVPAEEEYTFIIEDDRDLVANFELECVDPIVNAGSDEMVCDSSSFTLNGSAQNYSSVLWTGG